MNYLMILPVYYYRLDEKTVSLESAFVEHLKVLKRELYPSFSQMTVAMIEMTEAEYGQMKTSHSLISEEADGITIRTHYRSQDFNLHENWILSTSKFYLFHGISYAKNIFQLVKRADLIHGGPSYLWTPPNFLYIIFSFLLRRKTIFVVDIDFRKSGWMLYKTGEISKKSYWLDKYIYSPLLSFQIIVAASTGSLVLLKGQKMAQYYGRNRENVKDFLDTVHSSRYIISELDLEKKIFEFEQFKAPLKITYFGRLVKYKGVDLCLDAIEAVQRRTSQKIEFHIIGSGEEEAYLRAKTTKLGINEIVTFHGAYPFGHELFEHLYSCHLLLATPLKEDTPRSAIDAMAAGIPILAFDTYYYRNLESSGAVKTVEWMSVEQLYLNILEVNNDREKWAQMMRSGVDFAHQNTQDIWLKKRVDWTLKMFS